MGLILANDVYLVDYLVVVEMILLLSISTFYGVLVLLTCMNGKS